MNSDIQIYFRVFALAVMLIFIGTRELNLFIKDSHWETSMLAMFLSILLNIIFLEVGF